jgi:hypothetical protein
MKEVASPKSAKSYNNTNMMSNFFLDLCLVDDTILLHSLNKISNDIEKQSPGVNALGMKKRGNKWRRR